MITYYLAAQLHVFNNEGNQTISPEVTHVGNANPPHGLEPHPQRLMGAMHHCSGYQGHLVATFTTHQKMSVVYPCFRALASWTPKPVWPANTKQVVLTCFFCTEKFIKLHRGSRKIVGVHNAIHCIFWQRESSGYPNNEKMYFPSTKIVKLSIDTKVFLLLVP